MTNGDKRRYRKRSSKRYKVRYDRIVAVILVLVVLIVIITSCAKSCSGDEGGKKSGSQPTSASNTQPSIVDNLDTSGDTSAILTGGANGGTEATQPQFTSEIHNAADVNRGSLVLVNTEHEYKFPEEDIDLITLYGNIDTDCYNVSDMVVKLDSEVLSQLNDLMRGFKEAQNNNDIYVIGGYRTLEEQSDKYYNGNSSFQGGYSDYHTGRTFDMGIFPKDGSSSGYYSSTGVYAWIDEHAAEHGFTVRFPEGKESYTGERARTYTYRYVGAPHAVYMKQNELCLEEYINKLKEHTKESPLEVTVGSKLYQIYYVSANASGDTEVPVPSNKTYTVSGNNVDGFIVTVNMN